MAFQTIMPLQQTSWVGGGWGWSGGGWGGVLACAGWMMLCRLMSPIAQFGGCTHFCRTAMMVRVVDKWYHYIFTFLAASEGWTTTFMGFQMSSAWVFWCQVPASSFSKVWQGLAMQCTAPAKLQGTFNWNQFWPVVPSYHKRLDPCFSHMLSLLTWPMFLTHAFIVEMKLKCAWLSHFGWRFVVCWIFH